MNFKLISTYSPSPKRGANSDTSKSSGQIPVVDDYSPPSYENIYSKLRGKNLLIISHQYNRFTKEQIDCLADYFDKIHVYVRYNRLTKIGKKFRESYRKFSLDTKVEDHRPSNVTVHSTPLTYLPIKLWYDNLGRHHAIVVRRQLMRNPVDFDLIHAHFTWTAGYVGTKLSDSLDVPCAITIHENEDRLTQEIESENDAIQNTWRDADALIRVNKKDCNRLSKYNNSVYYIPNGFSRDRYPVIERAKARAELSISGNKTLIFALTALNSRKNVDMLIEAIGGLEVKEPVYCVIGGRGPERKHLENKINSVETINMIELIGFVPENELYLWMNACDIFTLTSDAEGNPTVMFEALGCGKPYVGTNVGGVDEIIHSSDYGLLCEPGDIKTYRDNLIEAIKRDWNNEKILQYGNKFTWERISRRVADVHVEQLIDE